MRACWNQSYIPIDFAIIAPNGAEAARQARNIPHVKHDHKDAIISVRAVTEREYLAQIDCNQNDPYLLAHNSSQQRTVLDQLQGRIFEEEVVRSRRRDKDSGFIDADETEDGPWHTRLKNWYKNEKEQDEW